MAVQSHTDAPPAAIRQAATHDRRAPDAALPRRLWRMLSLDDFEPAARRHLPRPVFGYVSGAAENNESLRDNRAAFAEYGFVPRVLKDVSQRSHATSLFGRSYAAPFGIAPMGMSALAAFRGDLVLARAAAAADIPMIVSGASLIRLEDVVAEAPHHAWFQAYLPGEPDRILPMVERVKRAGYATLVLTVDVPVGANRENNVRNGFTSPLKPSLRLAWQGATHPRWLVGTALRTLMRHGMPHFENAYATRGAPMLARQAARDFGARDQLDWRHLELMRRNWPGRLVVKGVMRRQDAVLARETGADGIIVSNHGGRQLDGTVSPLRVLPEIATEARGLTLMMDSGIRRGTDVLRALALGAEFVFVGRPFLYAAAIAGEAGVRHAIGLLMQEIYRDMALVGISTLEEMTPDLLMRPGGRAPA